MEIKKVVTYRINGKEYHSLEEMPEPLRKLFEDKNQDGVPDILEGTGIEVIKRVVRLGSPNDLSSSPPEVQEALRQRQPDSAPAKPAMRHLQFEGPSPWQWFLIPGVCHRRHRLFPQHRAIPEYPLSPSTACPLRRLSQA